MMMLRLLGVHDDRPPKRTIPFALALAGLVVGLTTATVANWGLARLDPQRGRRLVDHRHRVPGHEITALIG